MKLCWCCGKPATNVLQVGASKYHLCDQCRDDHEKHNEQAVQYARERKVS